MNVALLLEFLQRLQLFGHLVDSVLLFLAQRRHLSFVLRVRFFQVASKLLKLRLATLVRFQLPATPIIIIIIIIITADLEGGRAGSTPPPSGDGLTLSLTVMLANAKF